MVRADTRKPILDGVWRSFFQRLARLVPALTIVWSATTLESAPGGTPRRNEYVFEEGGLRRTWVVAPDGGLFEKNVLREERRRRTLTGRVAVQLRAGADPAVVARRIGAPRVERPPFAAGWAVITVPPGTAAPDAAETLAAMPEVLAATPLLARLRAKRWLPDDPLFAQQWHLLNTGAHRATPGIDVNVQDVWDTYTGNGITIGIVDDGLQTDHPDLGANAGTTFDWDWNDGDHDPGPDPFNGDFHGTACAGVAAAVGNNALGVCGAAFDATLVGLRLIAAPVSDVEEAEAAAHRNDVIEVKSQSWGPYDDARTLEGPGPLLAAALEHAVKTGRGGRGTIFTWAGGNGRQAGDDSNYDGYANSIYTIAIGAVDDQGKQAPYSESGANLVVCAPSDGSRRRQAITTTDLTDEDGYNVGQRHELAELDYTQTFGGTSAATPLAAGVIGLVLQANPTLGWRDVQEILIRSAALVSPDDADWTVNGAGFHFNHKFGAGLIDAAAAVALAQTWTNLGAQIVFQQEQCDLDLSVPDARPAGVVRTFSVPPGIRAEHVTLRVWIQHRFRGDLDIELVSPQGTRSRLARQHLDPGDDYNGWTFLSVRHWGEDAAGTWTVRVADRDAGVAGVLHGLCLRVYGTAAGPFVENDGCTLTAEGFAPANGAIENGEAVTVSLALRNVGSASTTNLTATLETGGGVANPGPSQNYGVLPAGGAPVSRSFSFTADAACGGTVHLSIRLQDGAADLGTLVVPLPVGVLTESTFTNPAPIQIPPSGRALPYPSTIEVTGLQGVVRRVAVRLDGVSHDYASDIDALLVGPHGEKVMLVSDVGNGEPVEDVTLLIDSEAASPLPAEHLLSSGTFCATNLGNGRDTFGRPAPRRARAAFDEFIGQQPNGTWSLFLKDDVRGGGGSISRGWALILTTADCPNQP